MLFFIFILFVIGLIVFTYYYFSNKADVQRRQSLYLARQNSELRKKVVDNPMESGTIKVQYIAPECKSVITKCDCSLYIAPLAASPVLSKIVKETMLEVLDSADVSGTLWYEISIPSPERINNKGWVKERDVSI